VYLGFEAYDIQSTGARASRRTRRTSAKRAQRRSRSRHRIATGPRAADGADVDAVFLGDADDLFPEYLRRLSRGDSPVGMTGLAIGGMRDQPAPLFHDLDALETPDYSDYFELREHLAREGFVLAPVHSLPFEASRGCWWGEKHH